MPFKLPRWSMETLRTLRRARRRRRICAHIDPSKPGLEIGPSYNGVMTKAEGFNVKILDYLGTEALRAKYEAEGVNCRRIEAVDYVWDGRPYADIIPGDERFDWIVASHVIEHAPCLVTFLRECDSILKPDGVLSLAIPDKRYTFDCLRERTSIAQVIDTFRSGTTRPTVGAYVDAHINAARRGGRLKWSHRWMGRLRYSHSMADVLATVREGATLNGFASMHNWVFTPSAARLLLSDLHELGYIAQRETGFSGTSGAEFFISLSRSGRGPQLARKTLALKAQRET